MSADPDLKQMMQTQMRLMEMLASRFAALEPSKTVEPLSVDQLARNICDFFYDPQAGVSFESWYKRYEDVFTVELANRDDETKVRLLLRKLGPAEHVRYTNYILPAEPRSRSFADTLQTLSKIFGDSTFLFNTRFQCLKLVKRETDDFITYAGIVNRECGRFKLGSLTEDQFRCLVFICGLQSPRYADLCTRLLAKTNQEPDIKLDQLIDECDRLINLKHDSALIQHSDRPSNTVHVVNTPRPQTPMQPVQSDRASSQKPPSACRQCGAWHFHRFCPFRQHQCQRCHKVGHKDGFCQPRSIGKGKPMDKTRFSTNPQFNSVGRSSSLLATFRVNTENRRKYASVYINGHLARLQLDTASDVTIISEKLWNTLGRPVVYPSSQTATSACGGAVQLIGRLKCSVFFRGITIQGTCYISKSPLNLLGLDWIEQLGLFDIPISTICNQVRSVAAPPSLADGVISKFASVFKEGLGLCTHTQASLKLRLGSQPVFRKKRPVPYATLPLVDQELQRLEQLGVLVPVTYSAWAAPIVVVKKSCGSIRICADFSTGLNGALESNFYPLPLPEDLYTMLNGGTCFAKLDLAEAYLQIEVSQDSRELLTINTHRGLFQYTRLPFGVKTAPAIFQQVMDALVAGLPGTVAYLDDIIIMGQSADELQDRIDAILMRIQDYGFRLRPDKCQFFLQSIKYLGFIFDANGRHPDPENVRAIQQMPAPHDLNTLRSFLGLISYYSAFLPALHEVRAPLNRLLQKEAPWNWSADCEAAFAKLKTMLSSDLLLTHYDPSLPVIVAADASNYGVGAVVLHVFPDGSQKAISHASRTLTPAEKNYGQIEKEALALIFAVKKFHKLLYGRHFTLLTDHKPLVSIFGSNKGIPVYSANRLQRWATILLGYQFSIQYRNTAAFGQADGLSRLISNHNTDTDDTVIAAVATECDINRQLSDAIRGIPVTTNDIQSATTLDPILSQAVKFIQSRWPAIPPTGELLQLYNRRGSLTVVDSCIMFAERVVIPASLRSTVLRQFHTGHPGTSRMKAIARGYAYWPGIDRQIEDLVKQCSKCQYAAKLPPKQPPIPWQSPSGPWARLHVDFAGPIDGFTYLVVVDAYSKWPEIVTLATATTTSTITTLRRIFSQHGLPETLVSDNGTQFTSAQFEDFCSRSNIQHIRSPPYHPQSNGQAERFVDTFKRALLKSRGEGTTEELLQAFLFVYRTTPNPATPEGKSPAETLMGRKLRTVHQALIPTQFSANVMPPADPDLPIGTLVYARDYRSSKDGWTEATVRAQRGRVLYEVTVNGDTWIRHRNQLRLRHNSASGDNDQTQLPLDLLLETFELPKRPSTPARTIQVDTPVSLLPRRWTDRARRSVRPMQVDPRAKQYR